MIEYIKKFESAESADNYIIHKVPFLTTINGTQNLTCSETGMKIINDNDVICVVQNHSTVVPIVPIFYIYYIWTIIDSGNNELPYIVEKINNSRAHTEINGCVFLKYPNELLNFNIHNVYDFFESIDESGIHKNYIFNSPVYNDSSDLLDPDNFRFFTKFLGWHNLAITDLPAMNSDAKRYANTWYELVGVCFTRTR